MFLGCASGGEFAGCKVTVLSELFEELGSANGWVGEGDRVISADGSTVARINARLSYAFSTLKVIGSDGPRRTGTTHSVC